MQCTSSSTAEAVELPLEDICLSLSQELVGGKYGILDSLSPPGRSSTTDDDVKKEIVAWLLEEM